MSTYEIIGRVFTFLGISLLVVLMVQLILYIAWTALKEFLGWPKIVKALRLLEEHNENKTQG